MRAAANCKRFKMLTKTKNLHIKLKKNISVILKSYSLEKNSVLTSISSFLSILAQAVRFSFKI